MAQSIGTVLHGPCMTWLDDGCSCSYSQDEETKCADLFLNVWSRCTVNASLTKFGDGWEQLLFLDTSCVSLAVSFHKNPFIILALTWHKLLREMMGFCWLLSHNWTIPDRSLFYLSFFAFSALSYIHRHPFSWHLSYLETSTCGEDPLLRAQHGALYHPLASGCPLFAM